MDLENNSYDEIEDEMVRGGLDRVKVSINGVTQNKPNPKSRQDAGEDLNAVMTDSLDFENSDDLNKIIQKYENMLGTTTSATAKSQVK
jgi:hypothetical protein